MTAVPAAERIYLRTPRPAEDRTLRLLGARWDRTAGAFWVDRRWPDIARFARWLPT